LGIGGFIEMDRNDESTNEETSRVRALSFVINSDFDIRISSLGCPMVAKLEGPQFSGGANIAIKCPSHTYEQTIAFYRDTLGLPLIEEEKDGCIFQFGPNRLWIDSVPNLSHPDIWLELETNDTEAAAAFLKVQAVTRRDEVEQLREDFNGFFVSAPNGVIHLVVGPEEA